MAYRYRWVIGAALFSMVSFFAYVYDLQPLWNRKQVLSQTLNRPSDTPSLSRAASHLQQYTNYPSPLSKLTQLIMEMDLTAISIAPNDDGRLLSFTVSISEHTKALRLLNSLVERATITQIELGLSKDKMLKVGVTYHEKNDLDAHHAKINNLLSMCMSTLDVSNPIINDYLYPLSMARLMSVSKENHRVRAWLLWPNGRVEIVKVGSRIAKEQAEVASISSDGLSVFINNKYTKVSF